MQKSLEKYAPILSWLKFKHAHLWKIVECDNNFGPPKCAFTLIGQWNWFILKFLEKYTFGIHN
jgi:hypothetical protein